MHSVEKYLDYCTGILRRVLNRKQVSVVPCCGVPQEAEVKDVQGA